MVTIIDGNKISNEIYIKLRADLKKTKTRPGLGIVLIGNNLASHKYVSLKEKKCLELGFAFKLKKLKQNTQEREIIKTIEEFNRDPIIHGIVVQLPLPKHINFLNIVSKIKPKKDVEGLNPINFSHSIFNQKYMGVIPQTILKLFSAYKINIKHKSVVILNNSYLVGKALFYTLLNNDVGTVVCCSKITEIKTYTKTADIIIAAVGKPKLITADMIKKNAIIIDMGFNLINNKVVGDVDYQQVKNISAYITPNPGGVGPVTVAILLTNTFKLMKKYEMQGL